MGVGRMFYSCSNLTMDLTIVPNQECEALKNCLVNMYMGGAEREDVESRLICYVRRRFERYHTEDLEML